MPNANLNARLNAAHSRPGQLQQTVAAYTAELSARRNQLEDDLAIYQGKLSDLRKLDPLDFTGLQHLYTAHVQQIESLLSEFDGSGA